MNNRFSGEERGPAATMTMQLSQTAKTLLGSYLDDVIFHGVTHDLAHGMHFEFSHDIGSMSFGCLNADSESNRHFLTAFPFS